MVAIQCQGRTTTGRKKQLGDNKRLSICHGIEKFDKDLLLKAPIPFEDTHRVYGFAILYFDNGFIIFGGHGKSGRTKVIARLDLATSSWSKLGDLNTARRFHNVIYDGEVFMVIDGNASLKTEKCVLSGSTMTCTQQAPTLNLYSQYPGLVIVPDDFCTEI